jgi:hypothetical protein
VDRHGSWLCQVAWFGIYVTESLGHISKNLISMRTNITPSTRVHFRLLRRSVAQRTCLKVTLQHGKQQSVKTPTQVKALLWYCWWSSKSRAASKCIGVVDLEDLIANGKLTASKSGIRLLFHERFLAALLSRTTAVTTSGAAVRCCPPHYQSVDVMDVAEEVLTFALLHKRIYKKKT